jgi:hypothetical protein
MWDCKKGIKVANKKNTRLKIYEMIIKCATNILNMQLQTADEGWSSSLRVERGTSNSSVVLVRKRTIPTERPQPAGCQL